jgi:hypothetical protein
MDGILNSFIAQSNLILGIVGLLALGYIVSGNTGESKVKRFLGVCAAIGLTFFIYTFYKSFSV